MKYSPSLFCYISVYMLCNKTKIKMLFDYRDIQGSGLSNYVETFYTILGEQTSLDLLSLSAEIIVIGVLLYYGYYASNSLYSYPYNYHYYSGYNRRKYRPHHYKYR